MDKTVTASGSSLDKAEDCVGEHEQADYTDEPVAEGKGRETSEEQP